jgi:carboxyl-terminal processing protease
VYDGIEQGEKEMDFHLAYDKIPAADYKPFNPCKESQRKKSIELSKKRLQKNPYYSLVQQRAKELAAVRTSYTYSLNMSKFEEQEAALRAQDKPLRDYKNRSICDTVMALDVDMQGVKGDAIKEAQKLDWLKRYREDAGMDEAVRILFDWSGK